MLAYVYLQENISRKLTFIPYSNAKRVGLSRGLSVRLGHADRGAFRSRGTFGAVQEIRTVYLFLVERTLQCRSRKHGIMASLSDKSFILTIIRSQEELHHLRMHWLFSSYHRNRNRNRGSGKFGIINPLQSSRIVVPFDIHCRALRVNILRQSVTCHCLLRLLILLSV